MNKKILFATTLIIAVFCISGVLADTTSVSGTLAIEGLCGMEVGNNNIAFGTIDSIAHPGLHTTTDTTMIKNTGNTPFHPTVLGTDWNGLTVGTNPKAHLGVGTTEWTTGTEYNPLTTTENIIGYLQNYFDTKTVAYRVTIPTGLPTDDYHETITFSGCGEESPQTCSDGTVFNTCSADKPSFCDNGVLTDDCNQCGCPNPTDTCNLDGTCTAEQQTCSDGTAYGQCSATKPLYCDAGTLVNQCGQCGCSGTDVCQPDGSCKAPPLVQVNDVMDKSKPTITSDVTIQNEGSSPNEFVVTYCVNTISDSCVGALDTGTTSKLLSGGEIWNTQFTLSNVEGTPGQNYYFNVKVDWDTIPSWASKSFTLESDKTDHFDGSSIDTNKWNIIELGSPTVENSYLKALSTSRTQLSTKSTFNNKDMTLTMKGTIPTSVSLYNNKFFIGGANMVNTWGMMVTGATQKLMCWDVNGNQASGELSFAYSGERLWEFQETGGRIYLRVNGNPVGSIADCTSPEYKPLYMSISEGAQLDYVNIA